MHGLRFTLVDAPKQVIQSQWEELFYAWVKQEKPSLRGEVVVSFVIPAEMKELYYHSFGEHTATDVLSFRYQAQGISPDSEIESSAGEIIICTDVARKNAKKLHVSPGNELMTLFVHGLLHLLDYDHATNAERAAFKAKTHAIMRVVNQEPAPLWLLS